MLASLESCCTLYYLAPQKRCHRALPQCVRGAGTVPLPACVRREAGEQMHKACRHRHSIQGANLPAEGGAAQDLVVVVLVGWLGGSENEAVGRR
jgi:hypothetical protein